VKFLKKLREWLIMDLKFQSEQPSERDVFPGESHRKVSEAIEEYILQDGACKVIGLDGGFGSGKSSILHMLRAKILSRDNTFRVWFFDCEQNYQGSIKSNFINLFTKEIVSNFDSDKDKNKISEILEQSDIALGRKLVYGKKTVSEISPWAIALLVGIFFSTTFCKELVLSIKDWSAITSWTWFFVCLFFTLSPVFVLIAARYVNRKKISAGEWSLLSVFKGDTNDKISERIEISKEVGPLELKKVLNGHLEAVGDLKYIIVVDNLDRLPHDQLRGVWSDLEIFTDIESNATFHIVVPFCSDKVATHLSKDSAMNSYDAKEFIAKKFPVVFRTPPIIASGWKGAFKELWRETFAGQYMDELVVCANMLDRHNPVGGGAITPRIQKRYINDLVTTLLVTPGQPSIIVVAAYICMCKYNGLSVEVFLKKQASEVEDAISRTKSLLTSRFGMNVTDGWPVQVLQVHFQTSPNIALAELIDQPLLSSVENLDGKRMATISGYFGFDDAFRRLIDSDVNVAQVFKVLHKAFLGGSDGESLLSVVSIINDKLRREGFLIKEGAFGSEYFDAIEYMLNKGLDRSIFSKRLAKLYDDIKSFINKPYAVGEVDLRNEVLLEYDGYLAVVGGGKPPFVVELGEVFLHHIAGGSWKALKYSDFDLTKVGMTDSIRQLCATESLSFEKTITPDSNFLMMFEALSTSVKFGAGKYSVKEFGFTKAELVQVTSLIGSNPKDERLWLMVALSSSVDESTYATVTNYLTAESSSFVKLCASIICIRSKRFKELLLIPDVKAVFAEEVGAFDVLAKFTIDFGDLLSVLEHSGDGEFVSPYICSLISNRQVGAINVKDVLLRFGLVCDALESEGVGFNVALQWFESWAPHMMALAIPVSNLHPKLVGLMVDEKYSGDISLSMNLQSFYCAEDRSAEEWVGFLELESGNVDLLLKKFKQSNVTLQYSAAARDAALSLMQSAVDKGEELSSDLGLVRRLQCLSLLLRKNVLVGYSSALRALVLSPIAPSISSQIMASFGSSIQVFKPSNLQEQEQFIKILEFASIDPSNNEKVLGFIDGQSKYLSELELEDGYLVSFMGLLDGLRQYLPHLYEACQKKQGLLSKVRRKIKKIAGDKSSELIGASESMSKE
jgi:hypothetical protein